MCKLPSQCLFHKYIPVNFTMQNNICSWFLMISGSPVGGMHFQADLFQSTVAVEQPDAANVWMWSDVICRISLFHIWQLS